MLDKQTTLKYNLSATEIVQNLRALDAAGRLLKDPYRIDISGGMFIFKENNVSGDDSSWTDGFDSNFKPVILTPAFYGMLASFLEAEYSWDMPLSGMTFPCRLNGDRSVVPMTVDTCLLLNFCGMDHPHEQEKLEDAKKLHDHSNWCAISKKSDLEVGLECLWYVDAMLASGLFRDLAEISCYVVIQDIINRSRNEGPVEHEPLSQDTQPPFSDSPELEICTLGKRVHAGPTQAQFLEHSESGESEI